jgi:hypothetical protein
MCIFDGCNSKNKYGEYCYKHRINYLCKDKCIIIENFTNKESDYLKNDIINTILKIDPKTPTITSKSKKDLFKMLSNIVDDFKKYETKDIDIIVKLQKKIKRRIDNKVNILRGPGFKNHKICNNDTDFYSYDSIDDINQKYFYSYKDVSDFVWFFDIRSLNKLIEMKQPNPYTMKDLPSHVLEEVNKLNERLKLNKSDELIDTKNIKKTRKQIIKQKTIDLFADIDGTGYYCQPEWYLNLSRNYLKRLYKNMEDLWNYRLQLTNEIKSEICPPNGLNFTTRVSDVMRYNSKEDLQELILNDIIKFTNATTEENKKLGYMYFIVGLGSVSRDCLETHQWLAYI